MKHISSSRRINILRSPDGTISTAGAFRLLCCAAIVAACLEAAAAQAAIPSDALLQRLEPQGYVNDFAELLAPADRAAIEQRLAELQQKTSAEFALVTLKSLEGGQIDDFANKLFKKWGVGKKGKDNGVLLLVAVEDRKARVEVGYGLEPILPDALAGRVLDEQLFPAFKQQRDGQGLTAAVNRIAEIIERGEPGRPAPSHDFAVPQPRQVNMQPGIDPTGPLGFIAMAVIVMVIYWFISQITGLNQFRRRGGSSWNWMPPMWTGGSGFGSGAFGGGGFGGGGFGGGGFGGGGFGGFGGGSSGGGGASGGW